MTLPHPPRCHTFDAMNRRGVLALLMALTLALAAGLMAWGPVMSPALPKRAAEAHSLAWTADALSLSGSVAMVLAGLFGWRALRSATAGQCVRPWRLFLVTVALCGLGNGLHHALGAECTRLLSEFCCAAAASLLFIGALADRVNPSFSSVAACVGAMALAGSCFAWWAAGIAFDGTGDARGMIFVEALPMLGLLAGIASLQPSQRQGGAALIMLGVCAATRLAAVVFDAYFSGTGVISGQVLMQFAVATAVGQFAWRESPQASTVAEASNACNTSLNTTG